MKKTIMYSIILMILSAFMYSSITGYITNNVSIKQNGFFPAGIPSEPYANKIIGVSGVVRNDTIFPIKIEEISPIGGTGIEYYATVISTWGVSEITHEEVLELDTLEEKRMSPYTQYEVGIAYQFSDEYVANPAGYKITYTVLGVKFKRTIIYDR